MRFSAWMRETRNYKGKSVTECALAAGVKQPVWSEWENKQTGFRRETVLKIARALDEPEERALSVAFGRDEEKPDTELQRLLMGLTPEQTRIVLNVARATRESLLTV